MSNRIALLVALPEELHFAQEAMRDRGWFRTDAQANARKNVYMLNMPELGRQEEVGVYLIREMGNVASAAFVGSVFSRVPPELLILVGISGSLKPERVCLRDVVISTHVKYYEFDKIKGLSESSQNIRYFNRKPRCAEDVQSEIETKAKNDILVDRDDLMFDGGAVGRRLRDCIQHDDSNEFVQNYLGQLPSRRSGIKLRSQLNGLGIKEGCLLGSNSVIDSADAVDYIHRKNVFESADYYKIHNAEEFGRRCKWDHSDLLAVDMESYGFFKAISHISGKKTLLNAVAVRGISDLANGKESLDAIDKTARGDAAYNAMSVALDMIVYSCATRQVTV